MISNKTKLIAGFVLSATMIASFQQCSRAEFSSDPSLDPSGLGIITQVNPTTYDQSLNVPEYNGINDILFVLDDSCSMDSILSHVEQGLDSISSVSFPKNTKMAVTYMSPVKVTNNGVPDFFNPYYPQSLGTPGHMQLVSKASVDNYLNSHSSPMSSRFSLEACGDEWFSPSQLNTSGKSCLKAAMQSPSMCTLVEAGLTSLDQLIQKKIKSNSKLFRDRASLNVVFVSDTHDAGIDKYYGTTGNPSRLPSMEELRSRILESNPTLQSIKFNAITRLPIVGSPQLAGLNVVGSVPKNSSEEDLNGGEKANAYTYLDYVRQTNGVAMHAKSDDWSRAILDLMDIVKAPTSKIVTLLRKADVIVSVKVNNTTLDPADYSLQPDGITVEVKYPFENFKSYDIVVRFQST